jgi:hypothetical protein
VTHTTASFNSPIRFGRSTISADGTRIAFNQGEFRSGDYFEIMNKASCLSLLSNAILVYNTVHIGNILDQAQAAGRVFPPEAIAHVPPLLFDHVIVNGTYDFSDAKPIR